MKKILYTVSVLALLVAICGNPQSAATQVPTVNNTPSVSSTETQMQQNTSQSDHNTTQTSVLKNFSSKYFNLSFQYPSGYDIRDTQNEIDIAQTRYEEYEIGRDNSFMRIRRFDNNFSYADRSKSFPGETKSSIKIDGDVFAMYQSIDSNSCEGAALGKYTRIMFPKSELSMVQFECGENGPDYTSVEQQALSTIKLSK